MLQDVDQSMPVDCIFEDEENEVFGLFLPADKVKEDLNESRKNGLTKLWEIHGLLMDYLGC